MTSCENQQYLLLRTDILQITVVECPCSFSKGKGIPERLTQCVLFVPLLILAFTSSEAIYGAEFLYLRLNVALCLRCGILSDFDRGV